jgi:hypothetical protein
LYLSNHTSTLGFWRAITMIHIDPHKVDEQNDPQRFFKG